MGLSKHERLARRKSSRQCHWNNHPWLGIQNQCRVCLGFGQGHCPVGIRFRTIVLPPCPDVVGLLRLKGTDVGPYCMYGVRNTENPSASRRRVFAPIASAPSLDGGNAPLWGIAPATTRGQSEQRSGIGRDSQ
eukprot:3881440-Prymnesium_polylepis.2